MTMLSLDSRIEEKNEIGRQFINYEIQNVVRKC